MDARNIFLDKVKKACALNSDAALAARLELSPQQISRWRQGHDPLPQEQIARIARLAHVDSGEWLVLIEAEQAKGEARKAYASLVKRLGIAAVMAIATAPAMAAHFAYSGLLMPIMSAGRTTLTRLLRTLARRSTRYDSLPCL